jgi:hypothetical protein
MKTGIGTASIRLLRSQSLFSSGRLSAASVDIGCGGCLLESGPSGGLGYGNLAPSRLFSLFGFDNAAFPTYLFISGESHAPAVSGRRQCLSSRFFYIGAVRAPRTSWRVLCPVFQFREPEKASRW